jgi:hypothetical protein
MKKFNLLFFTILNLFFFLNNLKSNEDCQEVDFSHRFGEVRNQGDIGYCWAFSTASVIEDYICREMSSSFCRNYLSVFDVSRFDWGLGGKEGSLPFSSLKALVDSGEGVCLEKLAPYSKLGMSNSYSLSVGQRVKSLGRVFSAWKETVNSSYKESSFLSDILHFLFQAGVPRTEAEAIEKVMLIIEEQLKIDKIADPNKFILNALKSSQSESDFLKKVLITESCKANRIGFSQARLQGGEVSIEDNKRLFSILNPGAPVLASTTPEDIRRIKNKQLHLLNQLNEGLDIGASVGIGLSMGIMKDDNGENIYGRPSNPTRSIKFAPNHAMVAIGRRFNKRTGVCQFKIRNSWGRDDKLGLWQNENDVRDSLESVYYLE